MANGTPMRRGSTMGAVVLIAIGGLFLYANFAPGFNPWPVLALYWPAILILWGLYKLVNFIRFHNDPQRAHSTRLTGGDIFLLIFLLLIGSAFSGTYRKTTEWRSSSAPGDFHRAESVEVGEAESVEVRLEMVAGDLRLSGGAQQLLEADFDYDVKEWEPRLSYNVLGKRGKLSLRQPGRTSFILGNRRNRWDLRLNSDVPLELDIKMGAGHGTLALGGLNLTKLKFKIGAGQVEADFRGEWKQDLEADIEGGVGEAVIQLPRDVGVRVRVRGGIGSIDVEGLKKRGRSYVNDAYGKSPVTLELDVKGGIGSIRITG